MTAYGIAFGRGKAKRFLALPAGEGPHAKGWRPFVWTASDAKAEKFGSDAAARLAGEALGHLEWRVVVIPPRSRPGGNIGGSPVAVAVAA